MDTAGGWAARSRVSNSPRKASSVSNPPPPQTAASNCRPLPPPPPPAALLTLAQVGTQLTSLSMGDVSASGPFLTCMGAEAVV